jgi:hypothetical protein
MSHSLNYFLQLAEILVKLWLSTNSKIKVNKARQKINTKQICKRNHWCYSYKNKGKGKNRGRSKNRRKNKEKGQCSGEKWNNSRKTNLNS